MTLIKLLLLIFASIILIHQILARIVRRFWHFPAPAFIGRFLDSRFRRWVQPPDQLIERAGITEAMKVLDLGCGSGAFTVPIARAVGSEGRVYALDIQPGMLRQLATKLAKPENDSISNVKPILGSAHELPFADNSLDAVVMTTVLQETPNPGETLQEARRVLRAGGILAVTELFMDPDYPLKSTTIKLGQRAGFTLNEASGNFWNYTVRFTKPQEGC